MSQNLPSPGSDAGVQAVSGAARQRLGLGLILGMFIGVVCGAWGWFHIAPPQDRETLRFEIQHQLPGWTFVPESIGDQAQAILGTTNLFNGAFESEREAPVIVFAAEWNGDDPRQRTALPHTPDICWVGAGWIPVEAGQPRQVLLPLDGRELPFQCRLFAAPNGQRQLVVWCSIYGGKPFEDAERWIPEGVTPVERRARNLNHQRLSGLRHLWRAVRDRDGAARFKQFVRFSVSVGADWEESLDRLRVFAPQWIGVYAQSGDVGNG